MIAPAEERVVGVRVTIAVREWCVSGGRCGRVKAYLEAIEEAGVVWRWWGDKGGDWGGAWCRGSGGDRGGWRQGRVWDLVWGRGGEDGGGAA